MIHPQVIKALYKAGRAGGWSALRKLPPDLIEGSLNESPASWRETLGRISTPDIPYIIGSLICIAEIYPKLEPQTERVISLLTIDLERRTSL